MKLTWYLLFDGVVICDRKKAVVGETSKRYYAVRSTIMDF